MGKDITQILVESICERTLPNGGFAMHKDGGYRPDATAWATIALDAYGNNNDLVSSGRTRLSRDQKKDGRVVLSDLQPQAFWPTPLAVIAWQGSPSHEKVQLRAIDFLLKTTGKQFKKKDDSLLGHDTTIKGWPWIGGTHSWVEPTSMVLLALEITKNGEGNRAQEARRMLMDRQLAHGGWNYGNTTVFGQQLRPMPESTGMALNALSNRVSQEAVQKSINYLKEQVKHLRTPLSLGWCLLGLGSWKSYPAYAKEQILECIDRQKIYDAYDTPRLSLLLAALLGKNGFMGINNKWSI